MNLTRRQIQQIIKRTPQELRGKAIGSSGIREVFGRFTPSGANWSYVAGWTDDGILVVIRFGTIM